MKQKRVRQPLVLLISISLFLVFSTGHVFGDALYVDEVGNVGIGTNSPVVPLNVVGVSDVSLTGGGYMVIENESNGSNLAFDNNEIMARSASGTPVDLHIQSEGGSTTFGFANGGKVGIGTSAPTAPLHIEDSVSDYTKGTKLIISNSDTSDWSFGDISTGIEFYKEGTLNGYIRSVHTRAGGPHSNTDAGLVFGVAKSNEVAQDRVVIDERGKMGIGVPDPAYELDVDGSINCYKLYEWSDLNRKENINHIENALDRITKLRGVTYDWKEETTDETIETRRQIGVIAQEVESVFPEAVRTDDKGYKAVSYTSLVSPLIEAVKELKSENDKLKEDIDAIYSRLEALEKNRR